ncbi:MAG: hypothetical protein MJZ78_07785 [Bacteroidales bacterium]|nr:hypothetical protein [Bacteroidales bacterium]
MKRLLFVALLVLPLFAFAQQPVESIAMYSVVIGQDVPTEACNILKNKMRTIAAGNGYGAMNYMDRFVLSVNVDVVSNTVVPANPPKVSKKIDLTFIVGDIFENMTFASCVLSVNGVGKNDSKALISAFSSLKTNDETLGQMLSDASEKIVSFYDDETMFINKAKSLSMEGNYDEAIAYLMSIPQINEQCYRECQDYALVLYKENVNAESQSNFLSAKAEWTSDKSQNGAAKALAVLKRVDPASDYYSAALQLWDEISDKLSEDEKEAKEIAKTKYEDKQRFREGVLNACKSVGIAFGEHRPKSVTKLIRSWF